jgi:hypothetical protein
VSTDALTFHTDGTVTGLYTETVDLRSLGRLAVSRASLVEFDHRLQLWTVVFAGETAPAYRNPSRAACLAWERDVLNQ